MAHMRGGFKAHSAAKAAPPLPPFLQVGTDTWGVYGLYCHHWALPPLLAGWHCHMGGIRLVLPPRWRCDDGAGRGDHAHGAGEGEGGGEVWGGEGRISVDAVWALVVATMLMGQVRERGGWVRGGEGGGERMQCGRCNDG